MGTENRLVDCQMRGGVKWVKGVKRYQLPFIRLISPRDTIYNMVTITNYIVFCILKLLRNTKHNKTNKVNH